MLTATKQQKLLTSLKTYRKEFLDGGLKELDESGTRIMINRMLSDVFSYRHVSVNNSLNSTILICNYFVSDQNTNT